MWVKFGFTLFQIIVDGSHRFVAAMWLRDQALLFSYKVIDDVYTIVYTNL